MPDDLGMRAAACRFGRKPRNLPLAVLRQRPPAVDVGADRVTVMNKE